MTNREYPPQDELEARREVLCTSLADELTNPAYKRYCYELGPLTLEDVEDGLVDVDALERVVERYGWPSDTGDDFYRSRGYTLANFHGELFDTDIANKMTNFRAKLTVPPIRDVSEAGESLMKLCGLAPELHRAYAIAPVLMNDVHDVFETFNHLPMFEAVDGLRQYLADEENDAALKAVFVVYNMMTRLIRPQEGHTGDVDAHDALTH